MRIGIIKEGKTPTDERVPLTPNQVSRLMEDHSSIEWVVQASPHRRIKDEEYRSKGIQVVDDMPPCDFLLGVKEVPIPEIVPETTHFFFSHTIKMQPYNKPLLQAVLEKRAGLIDWECLTDAAGRRLIGFGRYAGIVGAYNGFRALGLKTTSYSLKKARDCEDREEVNRELQKVRLDPMKILLTGRGKVAKGAIEVLETLGIEKVGIRAFLNDTFDHPVYAQITFSEYFKRKDGAAFVIQDFYDHPEQHESDFMRFAEVTDMYIAGHYWDSNAPFLFTREDAKSPTFNISLIADISCDIDGPVASTIRPSTIDDPFYGYHPKTEAEVAFDHPEAITVMAVDNLPCELPRDASHDFGEMFIKSVLPSIVNGDKHDILKRATIANNGKVTDEYAYLQEWVAD